MNVVVLTGAGVSKESGLPTFRDGDGLWHGFRVEDIASPEAFERDPELVHQFYNLRRQWLLQENVVPNAAHRALANLEDALPEADFLLVTQNVDDLHERAGSRKILHMHGELLKVRCLETGEVFAWTSDLHLDTPHPRDPSRLGRLRPHVVWFGEYPLHLEEIQAAVAACDVFAAIGTSGHVYPAAGLVQWTRRDCHRVEINLADTFVASRFEQVIRGPASDTVPPWVRELIDALSE